MIIEVRKAFALGIAIIFFSVAFTCSAELPVAIDSAMVVLQGETVVVSLRAQDGDIDPLDPEAHPISFRILESPSHGLLSGTVSDVQYYPSGLALAEVRYTPDASYMGADVLVFEVADPTGETDIAEIQFDVRPTPFIGLDLSGWWSFSVTYDNDASMLKDLTSSCGVIASWEHLVLETQISLSDLSFDDLKLIGNVDFDDIGRIRATVDFDPLNGSFSYLSTVSNFNLGGVGFRHMFYLTTPVDDSYTRLQLSSQVGSVRVSNTLTLSGCSLDFSSNEIRVSLRLSDCDIRINGTLKNSCENGFDYFRLNISDLSLEPALYLPIDMDLKLTFTLEEKSAAINFSCDDLYVDCFRIYCDTVDEGLMVEMYGIEIQCSIDPYVRFRGATSFTAEKNGAVTGKSDYFEVYTLSGTFFSCCDLGSAWKVSVFFEEGAASLFDVGLFEISSDIAIARSLRLSFRFTHNTATNQVDWTTGFNILW